MVKSARIRVNIRKIKTFGFDDSLLGLAGEGE
jgi:hypothetical protein